MDLKAQNSPHSQWAPGPPRCRTEGRSPSHQPLGGRQTLNTLRKRQDRQAFHPEGSPDSLTRDAEEGGPRRKSDSHMGPGQTGSICMGIAESGEGNPNPAWRCMDSSPEVEGDFVGLEPWLPLWWWKLQWVPLRVPDLPGSLSRINSGWNSSSCSSLLPSQSKWREKTLIPRTYKRKGGLCYITENKCPSLGWTDKWNSIYTQWDVTASQKGIIYW